MKNREAWQPFICETSLFICCKGNKNWNKSFVPRDAFVLKIQSELCNPKYVRKVSELSRNWPLETGLFRVTQFPLYLRNAEFLSHQTSHSSWFFLHTKHVKRLAFQNKRIAAWQLTFRARKVLGTYEKPSSRPQLLKGCLALSSG